MPQNPLAFFARQFSGAFGVGQVDPQRALWNQARHGKYYAGVYGTAAYTSGSTSYAAQAGSTFRGSNQVAASISVGLATTYTGLCLSNPAASGVNLSVKRVTAAINASGSASFIGLITGWLAAGITTHTTSLNADVLNAYVGAAASGGSIVGAASKANLDAACTLVGTPAYDRWLGALAASTVTTFAADLDEDLIIPPGGYVAIGSSAAETTDFVGSFMWEEIAP